MNISSIIGILFAVGIFIAGLRISSEDITIFYDNASLFIVLGGTFVATAISFQFTKVFQLSKIFFRRVFFRKTIQYQDVIKEVMIASEKYRKGSELKSLSADVKDHFFKEALELYSEEVLEDEEFLDVMQERADKLNINYKEDANKIRTMSKYPPAFGMMGTTIGMIVLLANLGGEDALKMIGPAMGVCLITTLYGVAIANLFFVPFAENLTLENNETYLKNQMVVEGMELLIAKTNPIKVGIKLNSYLTPKDRLDWKKVVAA